MASSVVNERSRSRSQIGPAFPVITGFTILRKVYDGSVSAVYKARQDRLGREIALKLLKELPAPPDAVLDRFNRSAYVGARVVHKNMPVLFEAGTKDGYHFSVSEYVRGWTVKDLLQERGQLSERRSIDTALQVAEALAALHDKGVVHRNIKPKNILITNDGRCFLVGFGLAKCGAACFSTELASKPIGTPQFMAPELIRGNSGDSRTDLYALGITMYAMAAGTPPFEKGMPVTVMSQHVYREVPSLRACCPRYSRAYCDLVMELLRKDPEQRPSSVKEVICRLRSMSERVCTQDGSFPEDPLARVLDWLTTAPSGMRNLACFGRAAVLVLVIGLPVLAILQAFWRDDVAPGSRSAPMQLGAGTDRSQPNPETNVEPKKTMTSSSLGIMPIEAEYRRLVDMEGVFGRDGERGAKEWSCFLEAFPNAPVNVREEARKHVLKFNQMAGVLPPEEDKHPPPVGPEVEFDF